MSGSGAALASSTETGVGAGTLDWTALWPLCRELGAEWMVVEHDKPADPAGFAASSRAYLTANAA